MKKTIKIPESLFRAGAMEKKGDDLVMSISSEEPYKRYDWMNDEDYWEVLSHAPGDIEDSRLKGGLPHLFNHDRDQHLGRATGHEIRDGKCYVTGLKFSESDFAQTKKKDIESGALPDTSVGYRILDEGECVGAKDGMPIYKFKWAPHEFSSVTIPADPTVGAGRDSSNLTLREFSVEVTKGIDAPQKKRKTDNQPNKRSMATSAKKTESEEGDTMTVEMVKEQVDGARREAKERAKKINDYKGVAIEKYGAEPAEAQKLADKYISGEKDDSSFEDFREELFGACEKVKKIDEPNPQMGASKKEMRGFSVRNMILRLGQGQALEGFEKEATDWARKNYSQSDGNVERAGVTIPDDLLNCNMAEVHDWDSKAQNNKKEELIRGLQRLGVSTRALEASVYAAGGALVGVDLMTGSIIELLRNATVLNGIGIIEIGGLVGNVAIPKATGGATVYWVAEGASITESDQSFGQIYGVPHRMGCDTAYTKQLAAQASLAVEAFIRNDFAKQMAVEEDRVAFLGGVNPGEPVGIYYTTGVGAGVTFGGTATRLDMTQFEFDIENANALLGKLTLVTSPTSKQYLRNTLQVSASTFPLYLWQTMPGAREINGQKVGDVIGMDAVATKNITTNVVIVGAFGESFVKFRWAGLDLVVDPFTLKRTEQIELTLHQYLDQNLRYPVAFDTSTDAPASP